MKKKFIYILIVGIIIILFIPTPKKIDDNSIQYKAIIYKIVKGNQVLDNENSQKYIEFSIFGKTIYSNKNNINNDLQSEKELEIEDIVSEDGLLFSIQSNKNDCVYVLLEIYEDNIFKFKFAHVANEEIINQIDTTLYSKTFTTSYEYDVINIIKSSTDIDKVNNIDEYDYIIITGKDNHKYVLNKNNEYLSEFLTLVNLNLDTCSEKDYLEE